MKSNISTSTKRSQDTIKKIFTIAVTGAIAVAPFSVTTSSQAAPPDHAPAHGYRGHKDKHKGKDKHKHRDRRDDDNDHHYHDRDDNDYRDRNDDDYDNDDNNDYNDKRSFTGTVVRVDSGRSFDLRVGGKTYNVSSSSRLPRGFNRGDIVRVYGTRDGNNDIVDARVSIVNNR